jgi:hypothetical protein
MAQCARNACLLAHPLARYAGCIALRISHLKALKHFAETWRHFANDGTSGGGCRFTA